MQKAVFLDRDGVINQTIIRMGKPRAPYALEELKFFVGVEEAVDQLKKHGFQLIIVTNQPDVARGWVDRSVVEAVNAKIMEDLPIDGLEVCYHTEKDGCDCRKPKPGMLLKASKERNINLKASYMVGDRHSDVEAGKSAGCISILVGEGDKVQVLNRPDHQAANLLEAAHWIISRSLIV